MPPPVHPHKPHHHRGKHHLTIPEWALAPTRVPLALLRAIYIAAKKYNIPPDVLAAIWRRESASTFPNPAVNSSGYGGLFGTTMWNGSTQAQADFAASIFHHALVTCKGNLQCANNIYATGRNIGNHTPPGQVSSGVVPGYGGKPSGHHTGSGDFFVNPNLPNLGHLLFGTGGGFFGTGIGGSSDSGIIPGVHPLGWIDKMIYAFAILGGGFVAILGFVLVAADIGLSSRASRAINQVPLTEAVIRGSKRVTKGAKPRTETSAASTRAEERREESHQASLRLKDAQTKKTKAQAKESRTRQKNRKKTRKEQEAAERKQYYAGARDAASPTMARIRKSRLGKEK